MNDENIYINGVPIPPPTQWDIDYSDISNNAFRDENGVEHHTEVRTDLRKVTAKWTNLTRNEMRLLLELRKPQYITISYPDDPLTFERHEIEVYTGDRKCILKPIKECNGVSFNLIER